MKNEAVVFLLYSNKTAISSGGLPFFLKKKIHVLQIAISSNDFVKIPMQTAVRGSGFIKKKKKKNIPLAVLRGHYSGKYFSLSCILGNIFVFGIILGKNS